MTENIIEAFLALAPIGIIAVISEFLWRKKVLRGEGGRKFVHILSGVWIALWPLFISFYKIQFLALILLVMVVISRLFHIFHAVHEVKRPTIGEYLYPLGILLSATLATRPWVFTLAVLYLAVADGFAALIGTRYEKWARPYYVFSNKKTIGGTVTYFFCALMISAFVIYVASDTKILLQDNLLLLLGIAFGATITENVLPYGTDNLIIPVAITYLLR